MRLNFQAYGESGPPLVIIHGLFGSLDNFGVISQKLSDQFRIFAVDARNHGRSPHSELMDYPEMAGDIAEFIGEGPIRVATGGGPAFVLGHSMGGKVAMELALSRRELVEALIVVDIAPRAYPPWHREILDALQDLDLSKCTDRRQLEAALEPSIPDLGLRRFLLKNATRLPEGQFSWKMNLDSIAQNYGRLGETITPGRTFDRPTLFIQGAESEYFDQRDEEEVRRMFPSAEFAVIPGARHWVHSDAPEAFIRTVREFGCRVRNCG